MSLAQRLGMVAALALTGVGCTVEEEVGCTLIGCADSLTVQLQGASDLADGDYTLTVTDTGNSDVQTCTLTMTAGQVTNIVGCSTIGPDATSLAFFDFVPTDATLVFTDSGGAVVVERTVALSYIESRPNGPNCEPVCFQTDPVPLDVTP